MIDVGTDSGVTYTDPIPVAVQVERGAALVERLSRAGVTVSIDTYDPEVAAATLEVGAAIVNDVSGLADPRIARLAAEPSPA